MRRPVLLVDDNADSREALAMLLRQDGYSVVEVSDGAEAMRHLRAGLRPCIILSDLMMPEQNGYQFREEQLDEPELATIPFIAYSGVSDVHATAAHLHANACVQVPFENDAMIALVDHYCDKC